MIKIATFALLALFLIHGPCVRAQTPNLAKEETKLAALAYTMYTDSSAQERFDACGQLIRGLVTTLKEENSYDYPFSELKGVSILQPEDKSFRIFSWELHVDRDNYRHYGAIQYPGETLKLTPLIDRGDSIRANPEMVAMKADKWMGYTAYKLVKGGTYRGRDYYLVFGHDRFGAYRRRKILDVLSFDEEGQPVFGLPIFDTYRDDGLKLVDRHRIILQYAAEATVAFNYDEALGGIVYENLVLVPGTHNEGPVHMPDGSYRALTLTPAGRYVEDERVFKTNPEINDAPVRTPETGDIFGRPKGGN